MLSFLDRFNKTVQALPNKNILVFEDYRLTYLEFDNISTNIANQIYSDFNKTVQSASNQDLTNKALLNKALLNKTVLNKKTKSFPWLPNSVQQSRIIPIIDTNEGWTLISIVAILKAGFGFTVINPALPQEKIDYIIQDVNAKFILTKEKFTLYLKNATTLNKATKNSNPSNKPSSSIKPNPNQGVSKSPNQCTGKSPIQAVGKNSINENLANGNLINENDVAFIVYTSGSTGNPKGVIHTNRSLNFCVNKTKQTITQFDDATGVEQLFVSAPLFFAGGLMPTFFYFANGVTVHLSPPSLKRDPKLIAKYIKDNKITRYCTIPIFLKEFLFYYQKGNRGNLKEIVTGGDVVQGIYSNKMQIAPWYGCSEHMGVITIFAVTKPMDNTPVGLANKHIKVYIEKKSGVLAKQGKVGEICVSSPLLATGYLNLEQETKAKFIKNPYSTNPENAMLYKTSDLGYIDGAGALCFYQRKDFMLKIRGYRIEPQEIEKAISSSFNEIERCTVTSFADALGQEQLACFYVCKKEISQSSFRKKLQEHLIDYMIPFVYSKIEKIPLSQAGKVDRKTIKKLAEQFSEQKIKDNNFIKPKTPKEIAVCKAFESVLKIEKVGIKADFYSLGGTSLQAVEIASLLDLYKIETIDILTKKTPEEIAKRRWGSGVGNGVRNSAEKSIKTKIAHNDLLPFAIYPVSFYEQELYIDQLLSPQETQYCLNFPLIFDKKIDETKLKRAIELVFSQNVHLDSAYINDGSKCIRKLKPNQKINFEYYDYGKSVDANFQDFLKKLNKPYNLNNPPLYRFYLIKCKNKSVFVINIHHILIDYTGFIILINKIAKAYTNNSSKSFYESKDSDKNTNYMDFVMYLQKQKNEIDKGIEFFENRFKDTDFTNNYMPIAKKRPKEKVWTSKNQTISLNKNEISQIASAYKVSNYAVYLGILGVLVSKFTNTKNPILGCLISNRLNKEQKNIIGMLTNNTAISFSIDSNCSLQSYFSKVNADLIDTYKHQLAPFGKVVNKVFGVTEENIHPLFQIGTNFITENESEIFFDSVTGKLIPNNTQYWTEDIHITITERQNNQVVFSFDYSNLFNDFTIKSIISDFQKAKNFLFQNINNSMDIASLLDSNKLEKKEVLSISYGKETKIDKCFVEAFNSIVKKFKNKVAVVYKNRKITYGMLDQITNYVCNYLKKKGVKSNDKVGVLLQRSEYLIIFYIAILKIKAAIIHLNPEAPADYNRFIIEDSKIKLTICNDYTEQQISNEFSYLNMSDIIEDIFYNASIFKNKNLISKNKKAKYSFNDIAMCFYTSGTTGKPKGVEINKIQLANFCQYSIENFNLSSKTKALAFADFSFDVSVAALYPTLLVGGTVYIIETELRLDIFEINKYIEKNEITYTAFPTSIGSPYIKNFYKSNSLEHLYLAGEAFPSIELKHSYKISNGYGPTEALCIISDFLVEKYYESVPIGKPATNTQIIIVSENGCLAPIFSYGEICVSGLQVSKNYMNLPELSKLKFCKNSFSKKKGYETYYRTGDIGRYLPNGNIEFLGRKDDQVKVSGHRIELLGIDSVFVKLNKQINLVKTIIKNGVLILCFSTFNNVKLDIEKLKNKLKTLLPIYMVPSKIIQVDKIPVNNRGKIDSKRLLSLSSTNSLFKGPENNMEQPLVIEKIPTFENKLYPIINKDIIKSYMVLKSLFSKILDIPENDLSENSDFVLLGGTSLQAVSLSFEINNKFSVQINPIKILQEKTVAKIMKLINQSQKEDLIYSFNTIKENKVINPLFFMHTANTGTESYLPLANALPKDLPFYGFEQYNLKSSIKVAGIENLASEYITHLKQKFPHGPYSLGGWSFGGILAYEMAVQLVKANEVIKSLILIDPLFGLQEDSPLLPEVGSKTAFAKYLTSFNIKVNSSIDFNESVLDSLYENHINNRKYMVDYKPKKYAQKVYLIRSDFSIIENKELAKQFYNQQNGLKDYAKNIETFDIKGVLHDDLLQGNSLKQITQIIKNIYYKN